jgi:two-component system, sensor histidine kinase and response regulator
MLGSLETMKVLLAGKGEWQNFMEGLSPFGYEFRCCSSAEDIGEALQEEPRAAFVVIGEDADWRSWLRSFRTASDDGAVPIVARMPIESLEACLAALDAGMDDVLLSEAAPGAAHIRIRSLLKTGGNLKRLLALQRAREELTHIIVHDLKSPLTLIMVELGMLERWWAKGLTEKFLTSLTRLNQKCEELARNIHAVVDAGKLEKGKLPLEPGNTRVQTLLKETLTQFGPKARARNVQVETESYGPDGVAVLDGELSMRALVTLLEVALRLTRDGGRMIVRTTSDDLRARIVINGGDRPLPPELLGCFFDSFAYLERRPLGLNAITGLGLHFCQMLFEAQGGVLEVHNRGDSGFCFEIELPMASRE